jgi:hypothetical protein
MSALVDTRLYGRAADMTGSSCTELQERLACERRRKVGDAAHDSFGATSNDKCLR